MNTPTTRKFRHWFFEQSVRRFNVCSWVPLLLPCAVAAQTAQPRAVSAFGPDGTVLECAIAASNDRAMSVYMVRVASDPPGRVEMGYALAERVNGNWTWTEEGLISPGQYNDVSGLTDPSVAADTINGDFLVCAMPRDQTRIAVARWDAINQSFGAWTDHATGGSNYDQPRIVAGEMQENQTNGPMFSTDIREFYITWRGGTPSGNILYYLHTKNGGGTWQGGPALYDLSNPTSYVPVENGARPAVYGARPLYVSYIDTFYDPVDGSFKIVRGVDVTSVPNAGLVTFDQVTDDSRDDITVHFNLHRGLLEKVVPGAEGPSTGIHGYGVSVAVDPMNANRLFLVYHDTDTLALDPNCLPPIPGCSALDPDVNIYLRILTRNPTTNRWTLGSRMLVADDANPNIETDQFMPEPIVDAGGVLHILYYTDQNYSQNDSDFYETKFDAFDAYTRDQGANWGYLNLCDNPQPGQNCAGTEPAAYIRDPSGPNPGWLVPMRDYIGIGRGPDRIWMNFIGNSHQHSGANHSVIWSSQVTPQ